MSRATIIGESSRVEQRIGIDLVAGRSQEAASVIAAEVVALRSNCATGVDNIRSACAGLENVVAELQPHRAASDSGRDVDAAAAGGGRVLAESATPDAQHCVSVFPVDINGATITAGRILAEGTISDAARGAARKGIVPDGASVEAG